MKIGIYGGTFDPFHEGHLEVCEKSIRQLNLKKLLILPASISPFKIFRSNRYSNRERTNIIKNFIEKSRLKNKMRVSRYDIDSEKTCYSIDTLKNFVLNVSHKKNIKFYYIMGADSYLKIKKYKEWETLFTLSYVVVVPRPKYTRKAKLFYNKESMKKFETKTIFLEGNGINISSTEIRRKK